MKFTEEEEQKIIAKWFRLSKRATSIHKDTFDLIEWALDEFSKLPENTTRWIHCSERLPTEEDANNKGEVWATTQDHIASTISFRALSRHDDVWWATPIKQLKKPSPPDPFEECWKNMQRFIYGEITKSDKEIARLAYEQGQLHSKSQQ